MGNKSSIATTKQKLSKEISEITKAVKKFKQIKVRKLKKREFSVFLMMRNMKTPIQEVKAKAAVNIKYVKYIQSSNVIVKYLSKTRSFCRKIDPKLSKKQLAESLFTSPKAGEGVLDQLRGVLWALDRLDLIERFRFRRSLLEVFGSQVTDFGEMDRKIPSDVSFITYKH